MLGYKTLTRRPWLFDKLSIMQLPCQIMEEEEEE